MVEVKSHLFSWFIYLYYVTIYVQPLKFIQVHCEKKKIIQNITQTFIGLKLGN